MSRADFLDYVCAYSTHSKQAVVILVADECGKTSNTGSIEYYALSNLIMHILDKLWNLLGITFPVTTAGEVLWKVGSAGGNSKSYSSLSHY